MFSSVQLRVEKIAFTTTKAPLPPPSFPHSHTHTLTPAFIYFHMSIFVSLFGVCSLPFLNLYDAFFFQFLLFFDSCSIFVCFFLQTFIIMSFLFFFECCSSSLPKLLYGFSCLLVSPSSVLPAEYVCLAFLSCLVL